MRDKHPKFKTSVKKKIAKRENLLKIQEEKGPDKCRACGKW